MRQPTASRVPGFLRSVHARVEPLEGRRLLSAGDLDPTFGTGGKATLSYTGSTEDTGKSISLMGDGRFVVGGSYYGAALGGTLARYLPGGAPDPTFGPAGSGKFRVDVPWTYGVDDAIANDDGTVIAMGTVPTGTAGADLPRAVRFTQAGVPDPTWSAPRAAAGITGLARDLVAAGAGRSILVTATMAVRLNANGTLDATFGNGGKALYNLDSARKRFAAYAGAAQPDGSLVVAGEWYDQDTALRTAAVRRYTPGGQLDASFGAGGPAAGTMVLPGVSSTKSSLRAVGVGADGNIVVGGYDVNDSLLARLTPDGLPDPAFAAGLGAPASPAPGVRVIPVASAAADKIYEVLVEPDGRVLAGGVNEAALEDGGSVFVLRLTAEGDDDWSFGGDGVLENPLPDPWLMATTPRLALQRVDGDGTDPYILMASGAYASANRDGSQTVSRLAPDGSTDASFGADGTGTVLTEFSAPLSVLDGRPALQDDGKLVFVGTPRLNSGDLLLGRLNADGTPDTAFGAADGVSDAISANDFGARLDWGAAVIALPGGKLFVVGNTQTYDWIDSWGYQTLAARFNPDGTLDTTFGDGGKTLTDLGGVVGQGLYHAAVQPDGKLLGAGHNWYSGGVRIPVVARYTEDGQPDGTFGDGGNVELDLPGRTEEQVTKIAATADGKILVAGSLLSPVPGSTAVNGDRFVLRLNDDGTLDTTFGTAGDGVVILDSGSRDESSIGMALAPGGGIFVAGKIRETADRITLTRLGPDGAVDASFGTAGTAGVPLPVSRDAVTGFRMTPQGQFLFSGTRQRPLGSSNYDRDFLVVRLDPAGVPDAAFGPGGVRSYDVAGTGDGAGDAFATADGKIIVAGRSTLSNVAGTPFQWAAVRVEGDAAPPPPASVAGRFVFYNGSSFDANRPAADPFDDGAIAPDKQALLPGQAAGAANVTSYSRGINGVMLDVLRLPGELAADDFEFAVGTPGGAWDAAPAPASVGRRAEVGTAGSDRVTLTWADGAVRNTWLRVTVKANAHTGLAAPDVFYFGNLVGEGGDGTGPLLRVSALDLGGVKRALNTTSAINARYDFNRDGRVNALDLGSVKSNLNRSLALPTAPAPAGATAGATAGLAAPAAAPTRAASPEGGAAFAVRRVWDEPPAAPLA